jgi:cobalt-zinc-cadmium efflux system outer membrane protein
MLLKYIKKNSLPSLLISFLCIFPGCSYLDYKETNIEVKSINEELGLASINSPDFIRFLSDKGYNNQELPIKNWGLNELLLAQQFYNKKIAIAKSEWEIIKGNEGLATLGPTTSVGIAIGKTDSNEEISKNIFGAGISFVFESANKKMIRHEVAFNKTQSAFLTYQISVSENKINLLQDLVSYIENQDLIIIQKKEVKLNQSILHMLKKRFDLGLASQVNLDRHTLNISNAYQLLVSFQIKQENLKRKIATQTGMIFEQFNLIPLKTDDIKATLKKASETFSNKQKVSEIKEAATLNSLSLRKLLADYAISESTLKYEIAKQYPDYIFSPAYTYDLGNYIWSLGIDSLISSSKRNEILINKAKKIRTVQVNKIYTYQLNLINRAENLIPRFEGITRQLDHSQTLVEARKRLENQLQNQLKNGLMSRLDLELELVGLFEVDKKYHKALYNLINSGLDAERIMQKPIITNKVYLIDEK